MFRIFSLTLTVFLCVGASLRAELFVPSAQEQALASIITASSDQKREFMARSDALCRVARARAQDMANRRYFDHVNPDGKGPNYLVRQAGYPLPAWWGFGTRDNYIESISAGRASASDTFGGWLASPPHKEHVLGRSDFYKEQVVFGVGHARVPGSPYTDYWVFLSVPAEEGRAIQVLTPEDGVTLTDSVTGTPAPVVFSGIVTGAEPVAAVRFKISDALSPGGNGFGYALVTGKKWTVTNWPNQGQTVLTFQSVRLNGTVIVLDSETQRVLTVYRNPDAFSNIRRKPKWGRPHLH